MRGFALPRAARMKGRRSWTHAFKTGKRFPLPSITIVVSRLPGTSSRLGIGIAKTAGCAVTRNRMRRLLREEFRLYRHQLPKDLILVAMVRTRLSAKLMLLIRSSFSTFLSTQVVGS